MSKVILEQHDFSENHLSHIATTYIDKYPIVYILYGKNTTKRPSAYIGQTVQVEKRMKQHLKNPKRKILKEALLIGHETFNQSATYNIETNLINHFIGDEQFQLQNVSQTRITQTHNYYQKSYYNENLFKEIWEILQKMGLAKESIDVIQNKDIYKISPYKQLSPEQEDIKEKIIEYCRKNISSNEKKVFMIEGDAGTGKSVVLASLFNTLQDFSKDKSSQLNQSDNYLLVNHGEMIKTYHAMTKSLPNLKKNHILRPTTFINRMDKDKKMADIVLVDEAHLLLTKKDSYNNFHYDNQLDEIIKRAKITVFIFDPKQVLKTKSYWNQTFLNNLKAKYSTHYFKLTNQFRMLSSEEVIQWIDDFVDKKIAPLPNSTNQFQFEVMDSSDKLKEKINKLNKKDKLSRIVSTFDYTHKKDGGVYLVDDGGLDMPWNSTNSDITWAERENTIGEVGSIYTVQGFDLNYVGVVLGPSIDYDEKNDCLKINISKYEDTGAFVRRGDLDDTEMDHAKEQIILNSINVLMKRGVHGLFIYAVNEKLKNHLLKLQQERNETNE